MEAKYKATQARIDKDAEKEGAVAGISKYYAGAVILAGDVRHDFAEAAE